MQIKLLRQVIRILYYDTNMDFYMFELSLISTVGIDATSPVKATFFLNGYSFLHIPFGKVAKISFFCHRNIQNTLTMANYINPFTDIGFKRIFGQEFSKPLLIAY